MAISCDFPLYSDPLTSQNVNKPYRLHPRPGPCHADGVYSLLRLVQSPIQKLLRLNESR